MAHKGESKFFEKPAEKPRTRQISTNSTPTTRNTKVSLKLNPKQRQILKEFRKKDTADTTVNKSTNNKSSPSQERRQLLKMMQQSNKPMTDAIERLAHILENKLDKAINVKEVQPKTSTLTKIQPDNIEEMLTESPITNPFEPMTDDEAKN